MGRFLLCAVIAVLAGIGFSEVMRELMPAAPDVVRGVFCGLIVAGSIAYLWLSDLTNMFTD